MKKLITTAILTVLIASTAVAGRQDYPEEYLGLPGDNLNLYAVMNLFQESETIEAFEKSLNDENSRINNLDLNGDGYVDYITASDYANGNVHTIVLRSALERNEYQDVAVFTVEQLRNGEVQIQLIGDEALYGKNYIVEPIYAETPNPGYRGRAVSRDNVTVVTTTYYEVAAWPVIRFIYSPHYTIWRSNWYWGYYPAYWSPWRPFYWHHYYGYHYNWHSHYYSHYRHWDQPRWNHYHDYYYGSVRAYSPNVSHRISEGSYRQTYSRPESRRDGEALYASTQAGRSSSGRPSTVSGGDRRSSASDGSRSAGSPAAVQNGESRRSAGSAAVQNSEGRRSAGSAAAAENGEGRRTTTSVQTRSEGRPAVSQGNDTRRSTSGTVKSAPVSTGRSTSPASNSDQAATRRTEPSGQRTQSTVQRSTQNSSAPAARTQSSSAGRSSSPAARTQSSNSGRSSAPAARTQSSSPSRSSSAPSQGRSSGSNSKSGNSESRSSRR